MDEGLRLSEFDIIGLIKLQDVEGIRKYVTPILDEQNSQTPIWYFSRSKEYYNVKSLTELSEEREQLKQLVTNSKTKRNFVIIENMLNCSAKSYFVKLEQYIKNPNEFNEAAYKMCRACLLEDTRNIIALLSGQGRILINNDLILPNGYENCEQRAIEMDNKAMLYLFAKNLALGENKANIQVATPGYGSLYIGPFLQVMYGYNFTNILKSKYIQETSGKKYGTDIKQVVSNEEIFRPDKRVILIDDNIGTGTTMEELREQLANYGIECYKTGAVQYNWRNYYKVTIGEKKDITKFNIDRFDIITPFNYAGHKLYRHAIAALLQSGRGYEEYLQTKSYRIDLCSDLIGAVKRGIIAARESGVLFTTRNILRKEDIESVSEIHEGIYQYLRAEQMQWIDALIDDVQNIEQQKKQIPQITCKATPDFPDDPDEMAI